ncbi:MAG: DNA recombination protein RmuC, partial [Paracoccus sp. (in: a-proteobacteria)]
MPQDFSARIIAWSGDLQTVQALLALLAVGLLMLVVLALRLRRALSAGGARETALQSRLQDADGRVHALELQIGQHEVRAETQRARLGELAEERDGLTDALHQARQEIAQMRTQLAETRLAAQKDHESATREIAALRELREEMTGQFRLLAAETLRVQQTDMQKAQGEQLSALLTPFRDQVHRFQSELQVRNKVLDEEGARLREQIAFLHQRSEDISREAVNLTRALKGEKQRQGAWR